MMESFSATSYCGFLGHVSLEVKTVLLGLVVFLLTVVLLSLRRPRNLPPGPMGWPVLGCLPQMALSGMEFHEYLSKLATRYGDLMSFYVGRKLIVVLNNSATMREALNQPQLSSRPAFPVADSISPGDGVFSASGPPWVELRRFTLTTLRGLGIGKASFEANISAEAEHLAAELRQRRGRPLDPRRLMNSALCNVICSVVLGRRFEYTDEAFAELLVKTYTLTRESGASFSVEKLPRFVVKYRLLAVVGRYMEAVARFFSHLSQLVDQHDDAEMSAESRDFIDEFRAACLAQERQGGGGGDEERRGVRPGNLLRTVGDLFIAGTDTGATTLRWGMLYLATFPEIQGRVQRELDAVTGRNRYPALSDRDNLPYTEATIREIQRISTVAPLSAPHLCTEDTKIEGYDIPKGALIVPNLWHSHFNPSVWSEPRKFRPERFLDTSGKLCVPEHFIPFGNGRRSCLGEHLAKMELFVFLTRLLHHFTISAPDGCSLSFQGDLGTTWSPRDFTVCFQERE